MSDTPLTPEEIHRLALAHERGEPWGYRDRERILAALSAATRQHAPAANPSPLPPANPSLMGDIQKGRCGKGQFRAALAPATPEAPR